VIASALRCKCCFLGGHLGLEHATYAFPATHTWQGKGNSDYCVVMADRNHCSLIAQYNLSESRGESGVAKLSVADTASSGDSG
jgi:hypothetical protein